MNKEGLIVEPGDDVVVVLEAVSKGDTVCYVVEGVEKQIVSISDIPVYHKISTRNIKKGEHIIKYGEKIGVATADIKLGEHVHVQNLDSEREDMEELKEGE